MKRVFLDASVLVAACASQEGASALILGWCRMRRLIGYISTDVVGEATKNATLKLGPAGKQRLDYFLKHTHLITVAAPSVEHILIVEGVIHPKDASILAAAMMSPAGFVLSLDKKHFFTKTVTQFVAPKKIMLPGDFVRKYLAPR